MPTRHTLPDGRPVVLARYVEHDPASRAYPAATSPAPLRSVDHGVGPVLDQGDIGSCTGNATVDNLNTATTRKLTGATVFRDESDAVAVYSKATRLDRVPGVYPPSDTGSTGLAAAKAARVLGYYAGGYSHVFGLYHFLRALQLAPVGVGTDWTPSMFTPDAEGYVTPHGEPVGGHEYLAYGYDAAVDAVLFQNSWGTAWGLNGLFRVRAAVFGVLLGHGGDGIVLRPTTASPGPSTVPSTR